MKRTIVTTAMSALLALMLAGCSAPATENDADNSDANAPSQSQAQEQEPEQGAQSDSSKLTATSFVAKCEAEFTDSQVQAIVLAASEVTARESLLSSKYDDTTTQEDVDAAVVSFDNVIQGYAASFGEEVQAATQSDASSVGKLLYNRYYEITKPQIDEAMDSLNNAQSS